MAAAIDIMRTEFDAACRHMLALALVYGERRGAMRPVGLGWIARRYGTGSVTTTRGGGRAVQSHLEPYSRVVRPQKCLGHLKRACSNQNALLLRRIVSVKSIKTSSAIALADRALG